MISAIEIHNKPNFNYRYATVSMLCINAWELILKAYVYKYISKTKIYEKNDEGNTISFRKALNYVNDDINKNENKKFTPIKTNLELIYLYRNTNVHYFEEELDPAIFMLLSKAVLNYSDFVEKYFKLDLSKDSNLIILPIGFNVPFNPVEYLNKNYQNEKNDFVSEIIKSIKELQANNIEESIIVGFETLLSSIKNIKNADIIAMIDQQNTKALPVVKAYRITNDPTAPAVRAEDLILELEYKDFIKEIKKRDNSLKANSLFYEIYKIIKEDSSLC